MHNVADLAQYSKRYKILYDLFDSYNRGEVCRQVAGPYFGQSFQYTWYDIGEPDNPVAFFKTDRPEILKQLVDKCDEWFVHGDYVDGVFLFLHDQEVTKIPKLTQTNGHLVKLVH